MNSPWQNPLPSEEYITHRVVIYFYTGRWVPIMFYPLAAAIDVYQKAKNQGQELYIFPANSLPNEFEQLYQQSYKKATPKHSSAQFERLKLVQVQ